jgi:hypothetical protein
MSEATLKGPDVVKREEENNATAKSNEADPNFVWYLQGGQQGGRQK